MERLPQQAGKKMWALYLDNPSTFRAQSPEQTFLIMGGQGFVNPPKL